MIEIIYLLTFSNLLSLASTAYFWRKSSISKSRPESIELQEFMVDLLSGGGLVHVKRIAPSDIVVRVRR